MTSLKRLTTLLRLSQWPKAIFVLLGVVYSTAWNYLPSALLAALSFCFTSSAVYIYNDLQDQNEDRLHPQKRQRPLAKGEISVDVAVGLLVFLLLIGLFLAWIISPLLAAIVGFYLLINLAYNHFLKQLVVFDVLCIASGFMLRVLAGTIGIGLVISWWLTCTATLVSLLIALCKRKLEKQLNLSGRTRAVLKNYSYNFLDTLIRTTAISCFFSYFLYTLLVHQDSFYFFLTLPFAAIGLGRFVWLTMRRTNTDDPIAVFLKDKLSCFNGLCFAGLTLLALAK